ncbi:MAG: LamG-like jellyroll fold domain-containing protein [Candidatus Diapherotrites archaeon]
MNESGRIRLALALILCIVCLSLLVNAFGDFSKGSDAFSFLDWRNAFTQEELDSTVFKDNLSAAQETLLFPAVEAEVSDKTVEDIIYFGTYAPTFTSASDGKVAGCGTAATTIKGGSTVYICTSATDSESNPLKLFVCQTNSATISGCGAGTYCSVSQSSYAANPSCSFTSESDNATHNWFAFLFDNTLAATNNPITGNYTTDLIAPTVSLNSVEGDTTGPYEDTIDNGSTNVLLNVSDSNAGVGSPAACKWGTTNVAYASLPNSCSAISGGKSSCKATGLKGSYTIYYACQDAVANASSTASVDFTVSGNAPTALVNYPNGGQSFSYNSDKNISIDFNVTDSDSNSIYADIYYSSTAGAFTKQIADDLNLSVYGSGLLKGLWHFSEGSGTTTLDSTSGANNLSFGTGNYAPTWTANGRYGSAISFNPDQNQYLYRNDDVDFNVLLTTSFSMGAWIKHPIEQVRTLGGGGEAIIAKTICTVIGYRINVAPNAKANVYIGDWGDGTKFCQATGTTDLNDNQWHNVIGVRSVADDKCYIYVDGALEGQGTDNSNANMNNTQPLAIGAYPACITCSLGTCGGHFNGLIDDPFFTKTALTSSEIQALYLTSCRDTSFAASTECYYDWNLMGLGDGNYFIDINLFDSMQNIGTDSSNALFQLDNNAPVVSINNLDGDSTAPYTDSLVDSNTNLALSISDLNANGVSCKWDSSNVAYASMANDCSGSTGLKTCSFGNLSSGAYDRYYACKDLGLNTSATASISFQVLSTQPTYATLFSPLGYERYSYNRDGNISIDFNVSDADSTDLNVSIYYSMSPAAYGTKLLDANLGILSDASLLLWWPIDENNGSTVNDLSGNGGNGTTYGGMSWVSGKFGPGLQAATNKYASGPTSLALGTSATISMWATPSMMLRKWVSGAEDKGLSLTTTSATCYLATASSGDSISCTRTFDANKWYMVSCTLDGSDRKIFVNGGECNSASASGDVNDSSGALYLGYDPTGGAYSTGKADDLRIFSRALSADEIMQLYKISCTNNSFASSTKCWYNWNLSAVPDGNFFIDLNVSDGENTPATDSSDYNFLVHNFAPTISVSSLANDASAPWEDTLKDFDTNAILDVNDFELAGVKCWWSSDSQMASPTECAKNSNLYACDFGYLMNNDYNRFYVCGDAMDNNSAITTLSFTVNVANTAPDANVNAPNGGETISYAKDGNYAIDFNVMDADNDWLYADIYYSDSQGAFTTQIVDDLNLNALGQCADTNFLDSTDCNYGWTMLSSLGDGNYFIDINVFDPSNAATADSSDAFFTVDNNAPILSVVSLAGDIEAPYLDSVSDNDSNLLLSVSDFNLAGVSCKWDSTNVAYASMANDCSAIDGNQITCAFGSVAAGTYDYYYSCSDNALNASTAEAISFTVQGAAPTIRVNSPNGGDTNSYVRDKNAVLDFNISDADSNQLFADIYYSSSAGAFTTQIVNDWNLSVVGRCASSNFSVSRRCTYDWNIIAVSDGNYFLDINVFDPQDNNSVDSSDAYFSLDNSAPVLSVVSLAGDTEEPYLDSVSDNDTNLLLSISDFNSNGVSCKWDSTNVAYASMANACGAISGSQVTCDFTNLTGGSYTYYYSCRDNALNASTAAAVSFTVQGAAPTALVNSPNGNQTWTYFLQGNKTLDFNVSDADSNQLFADIYYSSTPGAFENQILNDYNLSVPGRCASSNFSVSRRCTYDWNYSALPDGNYFIDINVFDPQDNNAVDSSDQNFRINNSGAAPTVVLALPNGGEQISYPNDGNYLLDFNVLDSDSSVLYADIYYSSAAGAFQNQIADNVNLANAFTVPATYQSWWKFGEGSGTTLRDANTTAANNLALSGSVSWVSGVFDKAITFSDSPDSYATRGDDPDFDIKLADSFSVGMWVKTTDLSGDLISKYSTYYALPIAGWAISVPYGLATFSVGNNLWNGLSCVCYGSRIADNHWHHIIGVRNVSTNSCYLYVDGALACTGTDNSTANMNNSEEIDIGKGFAGTIDEPFFIRRALSAAEASRISWCADRDFSDSTKCVYLWKTINGVADGNYFIDLNAFDPQDNNAVDSSDAFFELDNTAPVIAINNIGGDSTAPYLDSTNDSSTGIVLDITDFNAASVSCSWGTANLSFASLPNSCTRSASQFSCDLGNLADGNYTRYYACRDALLNTSSTGMVSFLVNALGPVTSSDINSGFIPSGFSASLFCSSPRGWLDSDYAYRKIITIDNSASATTLNNTYTLDVNAIDTAALIAAGKMKSNCSDLRVAYNGTTELSREVIGCNTTNTVIQFKLQNTISAGTIDYNYFLFYGNPSAGSPPNNYPDIFYLGDNFNDNSLKTLPARGFRTNNGSDANILVETSGRLLFNSTNDYEILAFNIGNSGDWALTAKLNSYTVNNDTHTGIYVGNLSVGTSGIAADYFGRYKYASRSVYCGEEAIGEGDNFQVVRRYPDGCYVGSMPSYASTTLPAWLRIIRRGGYNLYLISFNGTDWTQIGSYVSLNSAPLSASAPYFGLFSQVYSGSVAASFDNLSVKKDIATPPSYLLGGEEIYSQNNSACASTKYRLDSDASNAVSYGSWADYNSAIAFSADGNYAIQFYSIDNLGKTEPTNTMHAVIGTPVAPDANFNVLLQDTTINARYNSNFLIDFNVTDADFNVFSGNLHASIYYSSSPGQFSNSLVQNFDLNSLANPSLIGYWPLDEGSGYTAHDKGGVGTNLGLIFASSGSTYTNVGSHWVAGKMGQWAVDLNTIEKLRIANDFTFSTLTNALTLSMWVYPKDSGSAQTWALSDWLGVLTRNSGGTVSYSRSVESTPNYLTTITSTSNFTYNVWNHLSVTCSQENSAISLYVNGYADSSATLPASVPCIYPNYTNTTYFGMRMTNTGTLPNYPGMLSIDEIKLYNRALSKGELLREKLFAFPQPCSDVNFSNQADCGYDWNLSAIATGEYYIDINIFDDQGKSKTISSPAKLIISNFADTTGPTGSILINSGDIGTTSTTLDLSLTYSDDASGVANMSFSCNGTAWTAWESVSSTKSFSILSADNSAVGCDAEASSGYGSKTVYARFQDAEDNNGSSAYDTIFYDDAGAPTGNSVNISTFSGRNGYTNNITPPMSTTSTLAYYMKFSCDNATYSSNASYASAYSAFDVTLIANGCSSSDSNRTVYAIYSDSIGNSASAVQISPANSLYLDRTIPIVSSFTITDSSGYTNDTSPQFDITATDTGSSGLDSMKFSCNGKDWSNWFNYSATLNASTDDFNIGDYNLGCPGYESGLVTVYAKARDKAFNESEIISDTTYYDINPPNASVSIASNAPVLTDANLLLVISAYDDGSGVKDFALSCDNSSYSSWYDYNSYYVDENRAALIDFNALSGAGCSNNDGAIIIYAKARDNLNNTVTVYTTATLDLPIGPSEVDIDIIDNSGYTNNANPQMRIQAGASLDVNAIRFSCDNSTWGAEAVMQSDYNGFNITSGAGCSASEGAKTIYAQFYSPSLGSWAYTASDSTTYDATVPSGSVAINAAAYYVTGYTSDTTPLLNTTASDALSGLHEMSFSCDANNFTGWVVYKSQYFDFNLLDDSQGGCSNTDGNKTVYVKFKDKAGNQILANSSNDTVLTLQGDKTDFGGLIFFDDGDSFVIDTTNPYDVNVELDVAQWSGTLGYTNDDAPPLVVNGKDLIAGLHDMAFSCNGVDFSPKGQYTKYYSNFDVKPNSTQYGCTTRDGQRKVYIRITDRAGNAVVGSADTGVWWLDTENPTLSSVLVDSSMNNTTADSAPAISISAYDLVSGLYDLNMSCGSSGPWRTYSYSSIISDFNILSPVYGCTNGEGGRRVYAVVRDKAYNQSEVQFDDIIFDTSATTTPSVGIDGYAKNSWVRGATVTLTCTATASDVASYDFDYTLSDDGTGWTELATGDTDGSYAWVTPANDLNFAIRCRYKDNAANYSVYDYAYYLGLDKTAPTTTDDIPSGWQTSITVTLTCSDANGPSGCQRTYYKINSGGWVFYSSPFVLNLEGINTVYYYSLDNAGNTESLKSKTASIDAIQPTLNSITISDIGGYTNSSKPAIFVSATGDASYIKFNCNNSSTWQAFSYKISQGSIASFDVSQAGYGCLSGANGSVNVYAKLVDLAGNESAVVSDSTYYDTAAPTGTIIIENGAASTNDSTPLLSLSASDAASGVTEMQFSCNASSWSGWVPYATSYSAFNIYTTSYGCSLSDGLRRIYVRFRDKVGNVGPSASDLILVDLGPPVNNSISVTGFTGTPRYTSSTTPPLAISSNGASYMRFSCSSNPSSFSGNTPYSSSYSSFDIATGAGCSNTDGAKQVYAIFEDDTNNSSAPVSTYANGGYFYLDRSKPALNSLSITKTSGYTSDTTPSATLSASDATSGVHEARFSCNGTSWGAWASYSSSMVPNINLRYGFNGCLNSVDGNVTLYAQLRDKAYNISNEIRSDSVYVDTTGPTATISIEGGAETTSDYTPALSITGNDGTGIGVSQMQFSCNGSTWNAAWVNFSAAYSDFNIINSALGGCTYAAGTKYVFVRLRDTLGNIGEAASDSIILNWTPITGGNSITIIDNFGYTNNATPQMNISTNVSGTTLTHMRFSCDNSAWAAEVPYNTTYSSFNIASGSNGCSTANGSKTVYVQFKDSVGTWGYVASDSTTYDTVPPTGNSIAVNYTGATGYVNTALPTFALSSTGANRVRLSCNGITYTNPAIYSETYNSFNIKPQATAYGCPTSDGNRTVYAIYLDYAGNSAAAVNTASFVLDTAPPTSLALSTTYSGLDGYINTATPALALSATDGLSGLSGMQFSCNASDWTGWEAFASTKSNFNLESGSYGCGSTDGSTTVYARARDRAYNVSASAARSLIVDTQAPQNPSIFIERWTGESGYTFDDAPPLVMAATDATSGVYEMQYSCDNSDWTYPWIVYSYRYSTFDARPAAQQYGCTTGQGQKIIYVRFRDRAYNVSGEANTGYWILDQNAPLNLSISIEVFTGLGGYTNDSTPEFLLTADDTISGLSKARFSCNGFGFTDWFAFDGSDTYNSSTNDFDVKSGFNGCAAEDGNKTIYVEVMDKAGVFSVVSNSGIGADSFYVDTVVPSVSIDAPGENQFVSGNVLLYNTISDSGSGISSAWLTINSAAGPEGTTAGYPFDVNLSSAQSWDADWNSDSPVAEDLYALSVYAVDRAGNTSTAQRSFAVSRAAPTIQFLVPNPNNRYYSGSIDYNVYFQHFLLDDANVQVKNNSDGNSVISTQSASGLAATATTSKYLGTTANLSAYSDGTIFWVEAQAQDTAANHSSATTYFIVDNSNPTGSIAVLDTNGYTRSTNPDLNLSATDSTSSVESMRFSCDNSNWTGWAAFSSRYSGLSLIDSTAGCTSSDGSKTVYVQFRDSAGNISSSYSDTTTLDRAAPSGTIQIEGGSQTTNNDTPTLTLSAADNGGIGLKDMRFSCDSYTWAQYVNYATTYSDFNIFDTTIGGCIAGQGFREVYVQFRDSLDNLSHFFFDTIYVDMNIDSAAELEDCPDFIESENVSLAWAGASDSNSLAYFKIFISPNGQAWQELHQTSTAGETTYDFNFLAVDLNGVCGDGKCNPGENCPNDSLNCPIGTACTSGCRPQTGTTTNYSCGDGICSPGEYCPTDTLNGCAAGFFCRSGCQPDQNTIINDPTNPCGNGTCSTGEYCIYDNSYCYDAYGSDWVCKGGAGVDGCVQTTTVNYVCGDGTCDIGENCITDNSSCEVGNACINGCVPTNDTSALSGGKSFNAFQGSLDGFMYYRVETYDSVGNKANSTTKRCTIDKESPFQVPYTNGRAIVRSTSYGDYNLFIPSTGMASGADTNISIDYNSSPPTFQRGRLYAAFNFDAPEGTLTFLSDKPAKLTLTYSEGELSCAPTCSTADEQKLKIYRWDVDSNDWIAMQSTVDTVNNKITADMNHFSPWGYGEDTNAPTLASATISDSTCNQAQGCTSDSTPTITLVASADASDMNISCSASGPWLNQAYTSSVTNFDIASGSYGCGSTDGAATVYVKVSDDSGNWSSALSDSTYYDSTAPTLSITFPSDGASQSSSTVEIVYTGSDSGAGIKNYWVKVDSSAWINNSTNTSYSFDLQELGEHAYSVIATDNLDQNSSTESVTITVTSGGGPTGGEVCGNGSCTTSETRANCPADCWVCGDSFCDSPYESSANCAGDCPAQSCSDGTAYNACSAAKPLFCSNGSLVNDCSDCGCPNSGDTCNTDGSCTSVQADLTATLTSSGIAQNNSKVSFAAAVYNLGSTSATSFRVSLREGSPSGREIASRTVNSLAGSDGTSLLFEFTYDANDAAMASWQGKTISFYEVVDPDNSVAESNEANNNASTTVYFAGPELCGNLFDDNLNGLVDEGCIPNLFFKRIDVGKPVFVAGDLVRVDFNVLISSEDFDSNNFYVSFFENTLASQGIAVTFIGSLKKDKDVIMLFYYEEPVAQVITINTAGAVKQPAATALFQSEGTASTFYVFVDSTEVVTESNEQDNIMEVDIGSLITDLSFESSSVPATVFQGQRIDVNAVIANNSQADSGAFAVSVLLDKQTVASGNVPSLAPGAKANVHFSVNSGSISGAHDINILIDPSNLIAESDETNNNKFHLVFVEAGTELIYSYAKFLQQEQIVAGFWKPLADSSAYAFSVQGNSLAVSREISETQYNPDYSFSSNYLNSSLSTNAPYTLNISKNAVSFGSHDFSIIDKNMSAAYSQINGTSVSWWLDPVFLKRMHYERINNLSMIWWQQFLGGGA